MIVKYLCCVSDAQNWGQSQNLGKTALTCKKTTFIKYIICGLTKLATVCFKYKVANLAFLKCLYRVFSLACVLCAVQGPSNLILMNQEVFKSQTLTGLLTWVAEACSHCAWIMNMPPKLGRTFSLKVVSDVLKTFQFCHVSPTHLNMV